MNEAVAPRHAHLSIAARALGDIVQGRKPADVILAERYKEHRCGSRDRAQISALVYGVLRRYRELVWRCQSTDPQTLCTAALQAPMTEGLPEDVALNIPEALYPLLREQYGADLPELARSLCTEASVDLRVNTLRATRDQAIAALMRDGIAAVPTPWSPLGLRLKKRVPLQTTASYRDGLVEPQDEGSQLLALLVHAQLNERICDYCAGAGGKTLALGAQMQNRGQLWACDVSESRLRRIPERAQRAGLDILQYWRLAGDHPPGGGFDAVLVDAPCSATGTWRRNPELRLKPLDLPVLTELQYRLLADAAAQVKPGGRLVYATCSLLTQENDEVVERFLQSHASFRSADAGRVLRAQGIEYSGERLRLYPHQHGTDGFFAALLQRQ